MVLIRSLCFKKVPSIGGEIRVRPWVKRGKVGGFKDGGMIFWGKGELTVTKGS